MLIGIDASRATSATPTGTEVYSRELIRAMLALDSGDTFRLYTREPVARDFFAGKQNTAIRSIPFPRLWTHLRVSAEMLAHPVDLLFIPAHVLPPIHPRRSVVTIHDLGHLYYPEAHPATQRRYHLVTTRWNARAATHILADSEATRDDINHFCGVPADKITVVYPAYDAALFQRVEDASKIDDVCRRFRIDRDYILTIGTVHPRKNYVRLIQAMAKLDSDVGLAIVGKRGWLYGDILKEVGRLGLRERVHFLDYVSGDDLPALINGARVFAFPSLHEGFGLPVLEAQACGVPVVCSMTSSLPEAAGDGALFVDPCDVDAIAAAIDRLMKDKTLCDKVVANGFRNLERFSWKKSAQQVLDLMHRI